MVAKANVRKVHWRGWWHVMRHRRRVVILDAAPTTVAGSWRAAEAARRACL